MARGKWWQMAVLLAGLSLIGMGPRGPEPAVAQGTAGTEAWRSTITVQGQGEAVAAPDQMLLDVGVVTTAGTAREAQQENARRADQVIKGLLAQGIDRKDIQTVNYGVYPEYDYRPEKEGQPPKITGYRVINTLRVRVRNLEQAGLIIDRAVGDGANQVQSLQFVLSDTAAVQSEALARAVADARHKAEALARAVGRSLGEVLSVQEGGTSVPQPIYRALDLGGAGQAATPVEPGQLSFAASVQVVFALK
ncbi:MAG: SIMPL domain-containing protein [Moorellales bacterium]